MGETDMKEITVIANDRIGLLADVSEALAAKGINIHAISVEVISRSCIARIMVEDASAAKKVLEKGGYKVMDADLLVVHLKDQPGELAQVTRKLAKSQVSIHNILMVSRENGQTVLAMHVSDYDKAKATLGL